MVKKYMRRVRKKSKTQKAVKSSKFLTLKKMKSLLKT